jgi:hypothetical protein
MELGERDSMDYDDFEPFWRPSNAPPLPPIVYGTKRRRSSYEPVDDGTLDCLNYLAYDDDTWLKSEYDREGNRIEKTEGETG